MVSTVYPNMTATDFNRNAIQGGDAASRPRSGGEAPVIDTAEMVAGRILDAIESGPPEQFIDEAQQRRIAAMRPGGMR